MVLGGRAEKRGGWGAGLRRLPPKAASTPAKKRDHWSRLYEGREDHRGRPIHGRRNYPTLHCRFGRLAQWLERFAYTEDVGGPNPSTPSARFCKAS